MKILTTKSWTKNILAKKILSSLASRASLVVACLVVSEGQSFAQDIGIFQLPSDSIGLAPVAARIVSTEPLCPAGVVCVTNGTIIHLEYTLRGCLDKLGPVQYRVDFANANRRMTLTLSSVSILTAASQNTECVAAPTARYDITVIGPVFRASAIRLIDLAARR